MIVLASTSDKIEAVLAGAITTNQLQCFASYRDITTTDYTPGNKATNTNDTTDVEVVAAPASSTQRVVDLINVYNRDTATATVTIKLQNGAGEFILFTATLLTGERLSYIEGAGWVYYSATGSIKGQQTANGANNTIQLNNNGVLEGDSNLTWDGTTLSMGGTANKIEMDAVSSDPATPASKLLLYPKTVSGRYLWKQLGPSGIDTPLQPSMFQNNIVTWTPQAAAGVYMGTNGSNLGTPAIVLPTTTNLATMMRRSSFPSVVTTANQQLGIRTEAMFCRGNAANLGGFFFVCRFMFSTWTAGNRLFVGLTSGSTAVVTVQPSTLTNMLGFGVDAGDTAITFMHNDGAGTCTKDTIAGQPSLATNQGYIAYIFCKPNDSIVYYRLDDVNMQTTIIDTSTNTDLPVNTTLLTAQCIMGNAANTVAGNATIAPNFLYVETDI